MSYKIKIKDLKKAIYEAATDRSSEYKSLNFVDKIFKEEKSHVNQIKKIIKENKDKGRTLYNYLLNECGCSSKYDRVKDYMPYDDEIILYDDDITMEEDFDMPQEDDPHGESRYDQTIYPHPNYPHAHAGSTEHEIPDLNKSDRASLDDIINTIDTSMPDMDDERIYEEDVDNKKKDYKIDIGVYDHSSDRVLGFNYFQKNIMKNPMFNDKEGQMYVQYYKDYKGEPEFTVNGKKYSYVWAKYSKELPQPKRKKDFVPEYWVAEQMFEGKRKIKKAHMKGMNEQEVIREVKRMEKEGYSLTAFENEQQMNEYLSGGKKKVTENDNLPPGVSYQDIEAYLGEDFDVDYSDYPLLVQLEQQHSPYFVERLIEEFAHHQGINENEVDLDALVIEIKNVMKHGTASSYDEIFSDDIIRDLYKR